MERFELYEVGITFKFLPQKMVFESQLVLRRVGIQGTGF